MAFVSLIGRNTLLSISRRNYVTSTHDHSKANVTARVNQKAREIMSFESYKAQELTSLDEYTGPFN